MVAARAVDRDALLGGDRRALARAITLIESKRTEDRQAARALLDAVRERTGASIRIGISGVPGVGKSTFIEAFGQHALARGHRLAVLAVDPSSPVAGGSILGDKTRMEQLSRHPDAFIRPSPTGGAQGGVTHRTRECILLCEAAGYDWVIVETVGVGQSEFDVASMVDFFLVLMVPNAGDELQGLKKGIVELADALVVNKADGESKHQALITRQAYQSALRLLNGSTGSWVPRVETCSALHGERIDVVWQMIEDFVAAARANGRFVQRRSRQNTQWFRQLLREMLDARLRSDHEIVARLAALETRIAAGEMTPITAAAEIAMLL